MPHKQTLGDQLASIREAMNRPLDSLTEDEFLAAYWASLTDAERAQSETILNSILE